MGEVRPKLGFKAKKVGEEVEIGGEERADLKNVVNTYHYATFSKTADPQTWFVNSPPPLRNTPTSLRKFPAFVDSMRVLQGKPQPRELSFQIFPIQNTLSQPKELY